MGTLAVVWVLLVNLRVAGANAIIPDVLIDAFEDQSSCEVVKSVLSPDYSSKNMMLRCQEWRVKDYNYIRGKR